jgi:hypothetical protein
MLMIFCLQVTTLFCFKASQLLSSEFKLRDLDTVHYFLGIEVQPTGMSLMLRHHKYTFDILTRTGILSCKLVDTLYLHPKTTILPDPLFSDATRFCKIVGAFQYLIFTRSYICLIFWAFT